MEDIEEPKKLARIVAALRTLPPPIDAATAAKVRAMVRSSLIQWYVIGEDDRINPAKLSRAELAKRLRKDRPFTDVDGPEGLAAIEDVVLTVMEHLVEVLVACRTPLAKRSAKLLDNAAVVLQPECCGPNNVYAEVAAWVNAIANVELPTIGQALLWQGGPCPDLRKWRAAAAEERARGGAGEQPEPQRLVRL